jgi:Lon protease-like protein
MERIPIFPLAAVVFPGEYFNLHIFEPRYKQLLQDVEQNQLNFGIPYVDDKHKGEFGSEVKLHKIVNRHPGGELDIVVEGVNVFKVEHYDGPSDGKLYDQAYISRRVETNQAEQNAELGLLLHEYLALGTKDRANKQAEPLLYSYEAGIILGMHPAKKYKLIQCETEQKRQVWMRNELKLLIQTRKMELQLDRKFVLN